jgi:hypothetical protein
MISALLFAAACTGIKNPPLCRDLLDIYDRHQLSHAKNAKPAEAKKIDDTNLARVKAIINQFGWPGNSLVGEKASAAAWTIIQNADLATQKLYIEEMTAAAEVKQLSPALLAATVDRIAIREGRGQVYGTDEKAPIDDPEHVDDRRAKMGLPPLKKD